MSRYDHARALELSTRVFADSLSEREQNWLSQHLDSCPECKAQHEQLHAAINALKTVSISAGNDLVQGTQRRIRTLCLQTAARQRRMRPIWISSAFASVWMACTTPYLWQSFDVTGHWLHIPDLLWQMAFLVAWFTPALTGAAVALWLRPQLTRTASAQMARATA
jgi:anti-sigma factor RsiW